MARHDDDLDLIALFGLSAEEAGGLGLDASGRPPADDDPADGDAVMGLPSHAAPMPPAPLPAALDDASAGRSMLEGAASSPSFDEAPAALATAHGADEARLADEIALIAMLNGLEALGSDDSHGASWGPQATAQAPAVTPPQAHIAVTPPLAAREAPAAGRNAERAADPTETDDKDRFFVAGDAHSLSDDADDPLDVSTQLDSLSVDGQLDPLLSIEPPDPSLPAEELDLVSLFGLSGEEALGLGLVLTAPPLEPETDRGGDGTLPQYADVAATPPRTDGAFPTMPLHALDDAPDGEPGDDAPALEMARPLASAPTAMAELEAEGDSALETTAWPQTLLAAEVSSPDHPAATATQAENDEERAPIGATNATNDAAIVEAGAASDTPESGIGVRRESTVDPALLEAFAEESAELLDGMHVELERLETSHDDGEALLETRRIIHTLKGGAKMCGFEQVVTLTHSCENLLDLVAEGAAYLDATTLHALFACEPLLQAAVQSALAGDDTEVRGLADLAAYFDSLSGGHLPAIHDVTHATETENEAPMVADESQPDMNDEMDSALATPTVPADSGSITNMGASTSATAASTTTASASLIDPSPADPAPVAPPRLVNTSVTLSVADSIPDEEAVARPDTSGAAAEPRPGGRRNANSLHVDLSKVDAVVAKVTEMAAHRVSSQGMVTQLMDAAQEARRNVARLHTLVAQIGNECAAMQPAETPARDDELGLESYTPLNTLIQQLHEAVSDQQALIQSIHDTITSHWRLKATESRIDADIQSALMNIRLIPIANMRVRLDGVVRQAAQSTGKIVRWQLQGGAVALEKNVFDRLFEPLMHLLRNAIDHGIESPEVRDDAGKPETGLITVSATQDGNQIVIVVADDGAGIVPDRMAALAVERGVISADEAADLTPQQKIGLIFMPGFSTASALSHLSGRGVGMDVVRETCLRMGGSIDVHSRPGLGTTITMRLPLSLSVTRGLIVRDGGCLMALPVSQINALHLVPASDVVHTPLGRMARIEGQELPIYNLPPLPGARPSSYVQNGEVNVLQVPHDGGSIGVVIEDVLDEEEILIKAPPPLLRHVTTLLGAYVLPDGTVAPVINLPQMLADLRPVATLTPPREESKERALTALVVDDSMSMRVALSGTLQSAGFNVLTARDGQEALDVLKREGMPSLITLDIEMPRMDGLETLFAIRQLPGARDLPVFMMTSRGGAKHRRAADQLGATRYFTKPYRDSELAGAARAAVGQ